ncbi:16S rRNA (guanine(527)-N(7))-methyltransferase RsmG [Spirochaeta dissipatitropha]
MKSEERDLLIEGAAELGIELSEGEIKALSVYADEIALWNPKLGLVNAEGEELIRKHFLDSMAAVPFLRDFLARERVLTAADLGSGNGFPGVVLQILLPDVRFTLVERSGKRCGFLRNVSALLPGIELEVLQAELSQVDASFDLLVSRAFRPLQPEITAGMQRITAAGGSWVLYKGDSRKAAAELEAAGLQGGILPLKVPGVAEQRCLALAGRASVSTSGNQ